MMALRKCLLCVAVQEGSESQVSDSPYTNTILHVEIVDCRNFLCLLLDSSTYSAPTGVVARELP